MLVFTPHYRAHYPPFIEGRGDNVISGGVSPLRTPLAKQIPAILGLDLKKALFAIWLGDSPVQESLKKALLGAP